MTTRDWSWNSAQTPDSTCTWRLWPGVAFDLCHRKAQTARCVPGLRGISVGGLFLAVMIQRLNQLSWPSISAILVKSASHKHNDTMGFVQHETTLSIAKRIMLVKSKTVQTNSAWVDLTSLSFTSKSIQLNIRPYLNRRAVKPQGKSAPLLIIVTYSYCRQHPTAPETITWPTTAHHMQSSRGLPVAPVRAAAETMRGRWRV